MSDAVPLVDAHDIHVHYGESHVLRGVSLTVRAGESVGLLGRNGMGKTTLIRALMGHVRATRGRIAVRGQDATHAPPDRVARWGVAYVPEGRGIFANLSVRACPRASIIGTVKGEGLIVTGNPFNTVATLFNARRKLRRRLAGR